MKSRSEIRKNGQQAMAALYGFGKYLAKSSLEKSLHQLIEFRVSQINGCAFCLDMHSKDLLADGETAQRLLVLDAWREAPFYTERERAALAWAEAVTKLERGQVPDTIFEEAKKQFSDQELMDLTMAVLAINCWNRLNIAFPVPEAVGTYQPGQYAVQANNN